jgi:hypothetical protein
LRISRFVSLAAGAKIGKLVTSEQRNEEDIMYSIFTTQFDGVTFRWILEGQTENKEHAKTTVRTLRASGRSVLIKKDGKKVSWRI